MKLARQSVEEPQINLTSLIDVVFLLLIFFMVTTTFVRDAGLRVELPEAALDTAIDADRPLRVLVDAGDRIYIDGKVVSGQQGDLQAALKAAAGGDTGRVLRIRADGRASHQAVVSVMDAAAVLGFARVDIATRPVESGDVQGAVTGDGAGE